VISSYLKQGANYGTAPRSGRPITVSPRKSKAIIKAAEGKIITANQIKAQLGIGSSKHTILRTIRRCSDLKRLRLKRKPVLSDLHKAKRIDFAKRYMDLGEKWKYVIWSDEKKFNLDGPDGYDYYWHSLGEDAPVLSRRAMGGGGVMIWACFDFFGASEIILIEGSIDSGKYQSVLASHLLPFIASRNNPDTVFQQDNARPHVSGSTKGWLAAHQVPTIDWPPYSPDLNPIENLWGDLARRVYAKGRQFENIDQLKETLIYEWKQTKTLASFFIYKRENFQCLDQKRVKH